MYIYIYTYSILYIHCIMYVHTLLCIHTYIYIYTLLMNYNDLKVTSLEWWSVGVTIPEGSFLQMSELLYFTNIHIYTYIYIHIYIYIYIHIQSTVHTMFMCIYIHSITHYVYAYTHTLCPLCYVCLHILHRHKLVIHIHIHIQYIYSTYQNMIYNDIPLSLYIYNIYIHREGVMQPGYWRDIGDHHGWWLSVLTPNQIAEPGLCGNSPGILADFFGLWWRIFHWVRHIIYIYRNMMTCILQLIQVFQRCLWFACSNLSGTYECLDPLEGSR